MSEYGPAQCTSEHAIAAFLCILFNPRRVQLECTSHTKAPGSYCRQQELSLMNDSGHSIQNAAFGKLVRLI